MPFAFTFTFQKSLCEKPLLNTTFRHIVCQVYVVKQSCGKMPNKNCLKTKTWGFARVTA